MSLFRRHEEEAAEATRHPEPGHRSRKRDHRPLIQTSEPAPSAPPLAATPLLRRIAHAARPIAVGLGLKGAASDLASLHRSGSATSLEDLGVRRLHRAFETCATHAVRLRDAHGLIKACLGDLVDTLSKLLEGEGESRDALQDIRRQLLEAKEVADVEALRQALLLQASKLITSSEAREQAISEAQAYADERQQHARELEAALIGAEEAARTDPLTGLWNRRALDELVARGVQTPVGTLALDLDHFKAINDHFGHDGGDEVLRHVADTLRGELRGDDRAFRVGGEEFVVLLPESSWQGARATGERLRARVARHPVSLGDDRLVEVRCSIGVSLWSDGTEFAEVLKEADDALYRAKEAGRNRVVG